LFGVFDASAEGDIGGRGVVLCYPHAADYQSAFRSFRVLAGQLARAGFHVLRFDYLGTGDSWGDDEEASLQQWTLDVQCAIDEMESRGLQDISLVGFRLGASLAALTARTSARNSIDRIVLWEPVLDGPDYLASLTTLHQQWMAEERRCGRSTAGAADEFLGATIPSRLRSELQQLDPDGLGDIGAIGAYIVGHEPSASLDAYAARLRASGASVDVAVVEAPRLWGHTPAMPEPTVPARALQAIVQWLGGSSR
jgi:pimeloyl-ACP methyl ester carboxylesterase